MRAFKFIFTVLVAVLLSACAQPKTEGIVSVIDLSTSKPIANAVVKLYVDNPDNPSAGFYLCNDTELKTSWELTTNDGGFTEKVCFELPAVIKVDVSTGDGKTGTTTLALVEGETTTATCKVSN